MRILGISAFYHDSAAALVVDGRIIAAAQEERFTRKKHDPRFPRSAIASCLQQGGITLDQCDHVVFYEKPFIKFERLLETYLAFAPKGLMSFWAAMPAWLKEKIFLKDDIHKELAKAGNLSKDQLPPVLQAFGAVAPLVTDIDLSMDDRFLYVACWGTGEMRQYDVTDPRKPKLAGSVRIGGIARRTPHPNGKAYGGGPQMVEISRDGKRVYWTNSLYSTWDNQFYPDGIPVAEVMANANASGGLELANDYFVSFPDGYRAHQIRLEGGDCSTDSFCYPSV